MNSTDADPGKIKLALWNMLKAANVAEAIFMSNRPVTTKLGSFAVVDINGAITESKGNTRCVCMVQLFAKDIDSNGTENMTLLSQMYAALLLALPYNTAPYTFSKKNQVGRRDSVGFHATLINLDCLIY